MYENMGTSRFIQKMSKCSNVSHHDVESLKAYKQVIICRRFLVLYLHGWFCYCQVTCHQSTCVTTFCCEHLIVSVTTPSRVGGKCKFSMYLTTWAGSLSSMISTFQPDDMDLSSNIAHNIAQAASLLLIWIRWLGSRSFTE